MNTVNTVANMITSHRALVVREYNKEMGIDKNNRYYYKNPHVKKRKCLKCLKVFDSNHSGHRICGNCVQAEERKRARLRGYCK